MRRLVIPLLLTAAGIAGSALAGERVDTGPLLKKLQAVGAKGQGHREATAAWQRLSRADVSQLTEILGGMQGAGELGQNWIRAAVETIAQRELKQGGRLPVEALEEFLSDTDQAPRGRRLAYELIAGVDGTAPQRLIPPLLDDPSLELRRDAIVVQLAKAEGLVEAGSQADAVAAYRRALTASRDLDQIKAASAALRSLGQPVDVPVHMGFVMRWKLIGPFDNSDGKGFQEAYPPEHEFDPQAAYQGKVGKVRWIDHASRDEFGIVDLNVAFERPKQGDNYELTNEHKGAIAYAYTEFVTEAARDVELRLGCINANKLWINGEFVTANHVYHAGMEVDQYVVQTRLQAGHNTILLKIAQNEQTDSWAQRWQFQLRVCDSLGTAVLSQDRPRGRTAAIGRERR